jgi:hypothetical protein
MYTGFSTKDGQELSLSLGLKENPLIGW